MAFFDFLKSKKDPLNEIIEQLTNSMFPKGEKDIDSGANERLEILQHKIY